MALMAALFLLIAFAYSVVGFGGGSSYIAVMALLELPYEHIPPLALTCNLIVVTGGSYHFIRRGHFAPPLFWPFAATSIPASFIGGMLPLPKTVFLTLLGITLILAGARLLLQRAPIADTARLPPLGIALVTGAVLGLLSGLVGIGGGIFLAPLLLNVGWGLPKQIAATCSLFILVNSAAGLTGQVIKLGLPQNLLSYWPLALAVVAGGQIGSRLGSGRFSPALLCKLTAALVLLVGLRVLLKTAF